MEQYRKPNMFYKKWIVFISKISNKFGTGLNAFITFGRNKNESINRLRRGGSYPVSGRTGFHELRRIRML
jgi:hypothetical protein